MIKPSKVGSLSRSRQEGDGIKILGESYTPKLVVEGDR